MYGQPTRSPGSACRERSRAIHPNKPFACENNITTLSTLGTGWERKVAEQQCGGRRAGLGGGAQRVYGALRYSWHALVPAACIDPSSMAHLVGLRLVARRAAPALSELQVGLLSQRMEPPRIQRCVITRAPCGWVVLVSFHAWPHGPTDLIVDHQLELPSLESWPPTGRQLSRFKNHEGL